MTVSKVTKVEDLDGIWSDIWTPIDTIESIKKLNQIELLRWILKYAPCHGKFLDN